MARRPGERPPAGFRGSAPLSVGGMVGEVSVTSEGLAHQAVIPRGSFPTGFGRQLVSWVEMGLRSRTVARIFPEFRSESRSVLPVSPAPAEGLVELDEGIEEIVAGLDGAELGVEEEALGVQDIAVAGDPAFVA